MSLTSFNNSVEPPSAPQKFIWDVLVSEGAKAPKPLFPPVEVRMLSYAALAAQPLQR